MGQARSFLTLGGSFFWDQRIVLRVGLCGIGPALAGNVGTGGAFALSRGGGSGCRRSYARSGPIPLPPGGVVRGWLSRFFWDFKEGDGWIVLSVRGIQGGTGSEACGKSFGRERWGWRGCLRSLSPDHDHLRRCFGAGFEASACCSSRFVVVNGSVGMLFGRGCLRFGRFARL